MEGFQRIHTLEDQKKKKIYFRQIRGLLIDWLIFLDGKLMEEDEEEEKD